MPPITVFVADSDKRRCNLCLSLLRTAKIRVIGTARNAAEAITSADLKPQVLLFDLKLNENRDMPTLMCLRAKIPQTKVILLSGRAPDTLILDAISQGARGYLNSTLVRRFLVKAVRVVNAGESWVPRAMVAKLIDRLTRLNLEKSRLVKT